MIQAGKSTDIERIYRETYMHRQGKQEKIYTCGQAGRQIDKQPVI